MYIVLFPSTSERAMTPDTRTFKTYEALMTFLYGHHGDLGRVRVFEATELVLDFALTKKVDK